MIYHFPSPHTLPPHMSSISCGLSATRKRLLPYTLQPASRARHVAATRRNIMEGLGARPVDTLDKRTLHFTGGSDRSSENLKSYNADARPEVRITDLEYIGSYNWTDERVATIVVPGVLHSQHAY